MALGLRRLPRAGIVLASFSIVLMTLATAVSNAPNLPKYPFPLSQFYLPALAAGDLADNLGGLLGLPGLLSLAPLVVLLLAAAGWLWQEPSRENSDPVADGA
ncbi:MAG: hypothetical protein ABFS46_20110 [Myxococcota bacterium]